MKSLRSFGGRTLLLAGLSAALLPFVAACTKDKDKKAQSAERKAVEKPTLRIYALAGAAGAIEPCGCVKDMLGGIDHAAAVIEHGKKVAPNSLVVGAGPMFFENPALEGEENSQAIYKAEAMAASLAALKLLAWAPGANDWANGSLALEQLQKQSGAALLAANLRVAGAVGSQVVERAGLKIGIVGLSIPEAPLGRSPHDLPTGDDIADAKASLQQELGKLRAAKTDLVVALIAAPRGQALRLIEQAGDDIHVAVLGKPFDQGEANDTPITPEVIGKTLVVQAPNHVQALSVVDLYVRDGSPHFADGTGLAAHEEKVSLDARIEELQHRIDRWKAAGSSVKQSDVKARESELSALKQKRDAIHSAQPPQQGSYFLYDLVQVRESQGTDPEVSSRLLAYYKRVNEHNKQAFADRLPPAVSEGQASYVGIATCSNCHMEARAFWDKTQHAHAYATLESEHKEFNLDCVSCHVTGYEKPGGSTVTHVADFKSVQCETCHGPGSKHLDDPTDKSAIIAMPARTLCASTCHHPPHVGPDWSVDVAWPQIIGKGHGM